MSGFGLQERHRAGFVPAQPGARGSDAGYDHLERGRVASLPRTTHLDGSPRPVVASLPSVREPGTPSPGAQCAALNALVGELQALEPALTGYDHLRIGGPDTPDLV
ncbi:hypothetical protein GCM10010272_53950 [Streptomyces lateritius]|nr:hypothetical protein GCM10010272_53950 [Streptomyces lateritius]